MSVIPPKKKSRWDVTPVEKTKSTDKQLEYLLTKRFLHAELNKPWVNSELDIILPGPSAGYEVLWPPEKFARPRVREPSPEPSLEEFPSTVLKTSSISPAVLGLPPIHPDEEKFFEGALEGLNFEGREIDTNDSADVKASRRVKRILLFLRYGTPFQRKRNLKFLYDQISDNSIGPKTLYESVIPMFSIPNLNSLDILHLIRLLDGVNHYFKDLCRPYAKKLLSILGPMLISDDRSIRLSSRTVIGNLVTFVGLSTVYDSVRSEVMSADVGKRLIAANVISVTAASFGTDKIIPFCQPQVNQSQQNHDIQLKNQLKRLPILFPSPFFPT
ncbi:hypothetical protein GEMRC1_007358 [Eukaryota sp. GEM-RC1]